MKSMIDAVDIDMPFHERPQHPTAQWHPLRYHCPLCKSEFNTPVHTLKDCVLRLAERLDRIENPARGAACAPDER